MGNATFLSGRDNWQDAASQDAKKDETRAAVLLSGFLGDDYMIMTKPKEPANVFTSRTNGEKTVVTLMSDATNIFPRRCKAKFVRCLTLQRCHSSGFSPGQHSKRKSISKRSL